MHHGRTYTLSNTEWALGIEACSAIWRESNSRAYLLNLMLLAALFT